MLWTCYPGFETTTDERKRSVMLVGVHAMYERKENTMSTGVRGRC